MAATKSGDKGDFKTDIRFILTYGVGFISLLFLGFISGFAFGNIILGWSLEHSLILSLIVGTITLFVEGGLLVIRMIKMDDHMYNKE